MATRRSKTGAGAGKTRRPRGVCPECRKAWALRADGRLRAHRCGLTNRGGQRPFTDAEWLRVRTTEFIAALMPTRTDAEREAAIERVIAECTPATIDPPQGATTT